ncbi:zinc-binding dehydrogenase, partial [Lawsonibacter sp. DFI.6.74]|nr:zinc-binding dehydrogenase [Lawsonibacter sp. DFI.6.74]
IVAIDINDQRLAKAKELGASHIFNSKEEDPKAFINELTEGRGLDYVIDSTGVGPVMTKALHSVSNSGTFVPLAVTQK